MKKEINEIKTEHVAPKEVTPEILLILWLDGVLVGRELIDPATTRLIRERVREYLKPTTFICSVEAGTIVETTRKSRFWV